VNVPQLKPWDVPGFEVTCYGEAGGARIVARDAPHRPGRLEIAIQTGGAAPQCIVFGLEDAGSLLQALYLAVADLGLADHIVREILAKEERSAGPEVH